MPEDKLPTPSKYHQPCWELLLKEETPQEEQYLVWAPGEIAHAGHPSGKTRDFWQASWQTHNGGMGGTTRGDSLEAVLGIFPAKIAERFREVIAEQR